MARSGLARYVVAVCGWVRHGTNFFKERMMILTSDLLELSEKLAALREQKRIQEEAVKVTNKEIGEVEKLMIAAMIDADVPGFKHIGKNFSLVITKYPSPEADKKDELYAEFRRRGYDHLFSIHSGTLTSTIKEMMTNNGDVLPDWLARLVKTFEKTTIRIAKG